MATTGDNNEFIAAAKLTSSLVTAASVVSVTMLNHRKKQNFG